MLGRGICPLIVLAVVDAAQEISPPHALVGKSLVESKFFADAEDWTIEGMEAPVFHDPLNAKIYVRDTKDKAWYFVAPEKFLGDVSAAYNGKLAFTIGHYFFNTDDKKSLKHTGDVILESLCDWTLKINVFKPYDMSEEYVITLNEHGGWKDTRTNRAPGLWDFLGMLSNLKSIKIRGGYYLKEEKTNLGNVYLLHGTAWQPCCNVWNRIDYCAVPGSPYFNPPDLKFYCLGSWRQEINIESVEPRYARKSGGATLTIFGTHFGLKASEPVVKVDNQVCTRAWVEIEQEQVKCIIPPMMTGSAEEDVSVTITAFAYDQQDEYESTATSCISAAARSFTYFGHDVVWYKHIRPNRAGKMAVLTGVATNRNTGAVYVSGTFDTGTYIGESEVQLPSPREGATNVLVAKWGQDRHDPNGDQSSFGGKGNDNFGGHLAGQGENFRWAHAIGHKLSIALNEANAIAVDELRDEVVLVGSIQGKAEEQARFPIGREYDANTPDPSVPLNAMAMFACRLDGKGDVLWTTYGRMEQSALDVTVNNVFAWAVTVYRGDVYVTGYAEEVSSNPLNNYLFGNTETGFKTIGSRDYPHKFVWLAVFYQALGTPKWATWGDFGLVNGEAYGKALDVYKGSIYMAGWFYHVINSYSLKFYRPLGIATDNIIAPLTANQECYVVEYNLDGTPVRAAVSSGDGIRTGCQVFGVKAMRTFLNVVGRFFADQRSLDFGKDIDGHTIETGKTSGLSDYDGFLLQYLILRTHPMATVPPARAESPKHNFLPVWVKLLANPGIYAEMWEAVAVDEYYSEIYVVGTFGADIRIPYHAANDAQLRIGEVMQQKACAAKYSVIGKDIWAKAFKASGGWVSEATAIAILDTDAYIVGKFEFEVMMDNPDNVLQATGRWDGFLAKLRD